MMMSTTFSVADFESLIALIRLHTGLTVSDTKTDDMAEAIDKLIAARRLSGLPALLIILKDIPSTDPLWQELIDIVTVGETYFFRNKDQFNALQSDVFPAIIRKRIESGRKYLRIWCAGCATGEEPYSVAMLLREIIPDYKSWQITLLATDINVTSLERAKRGIYRSWSFRNETPQEVQDRWFRVEGENYRLDPTIKNMVTIRPLNLVSDQYPTFESDINHLDLIICRNVTIYFDQETTRKIVARFYESLDINGWLVVGHSEPMSSMYHEFVPRNFPNTIFYQKSPEEQSQTSASAFWSELLPVTTEPKILAPQKTIAREEKAPVRPKIELPETKPLPPTKPLPTPKSTWQQAKATADLEQWKEALILLAKAEAEDKFQPQVFYLRAIVQIHLDDTVGAFVSLRQTLYCDSQFALAHYTLGELCEQAKDYKNAARYWKSAKAAIANLNPDAFLPFGEDLTVEMLKGLLESAVRRLPA